MLKLLNRAIAKIANLAYYKGYAVNLENLKNSPEFEEYNLENLGKWFYKKSETWFCISPMEKEDFIASFFEMTKLPKEKILIERRSVPFVMFYG